MQALIVHSHPEARSFNGTLTRTARDTLTAQGYSVTVSDLYAEGFDPVEAPAHYPRRTDHTRFSPLAEQRHAWQSSALPTDVQREIRRLEQADLLLLQFPLWWHAAPAMLKGWFDRVMVSGGLYTSRMRYDAGYFRGRKALLSVTTGAPASALEPGGRGGDIQALLWPLHYSLHYLGFDVLPPYIAGGIQGHGYQYRDDGAFSQHLQTQQDNWRKHLQQLHALSPLPFPGWNDWDETGRARGSAG
ncbi:MAG: NAD(P)H-dependent oxidoreductase [Pseudomonadales bacterium]|nr:NAD(P)H-dependent oxidoreductase [Pseudomonadales bacterium]